MTDSRKPAFISSVHAVLGDFRHIRDLPELAGDTASVEYLTNLGLERYSVQSREPLDVLAEAVSGCLAKAGLRGDQVDATIFFSTLFDLEKEQNDLALLSNRLGLSRSVSFGMFLNQCTNHSQCLMLARHLVGDEDHRNVLLIGADRVREPFLRTMPNNTSVYSDAAVCCLVSSDDRGEYKLGGIAHKYLPDMAGLTHPGKVIEFISRYSHGFQSVCDELYGKTGTGPDDYRFLVTANYNLSVLKNLGRLSRIMGDRQFTANVPRYAHCFSTDHFIGMDTLLRQGTLARGDRLNLVAVGGFWTYSAVSVEKT